MNKILLTMILTTLIIFAGCSTQEKVTTSQKEFVEVVITKVGFNPIFYPLDNNKVPMPEGVEVKLRTAGYSQAELFTLSSDSNLVGILSNVNVGKAYEEGQPYKVIAPYYREVVGPEGFSMGQVAVKKDSGINGVKDLIGKKVGIQGSADGSTIAMMTAMRNKYDINLDEIEFIAVESELAPQLVSSGDLDAAMFDSDFLIDDNYDEAFRTLMDFGLDLQELYGVVPPAKFFVVRTDIYEKNPELFNNAVSYIEENYKWTQENIEEISRIEADATGDDYETLIWKFDYESRLDKLTTDDLIAYEAFYETAVDRGVLDEVPENLEELFVLN